MQHIRSVVMWRLMVALSACVAVSMAALGMGSGFASAAPSSAGPQVVYLSQSDVADLNAAADVTGEPHLPAGTDGLKITDDQTVVPVDAQGNPIIQLRSPWGTAWKYTKCAAAVALAFTSTSKAYNAIKGLGGVASAARLLIGAGKLSDVGKIGGNLALQVAGISGIQAACF